MAHLHEVLAVESELDKVYKKVLEETDHVFRQKPDHFLSTVKTYEPYDENDMERGEVDRKAMVTTVRRKLEYMFQHVVRFVDAVFQKEATNQQAVADIEIDGVEIARNVPATMLLGLENKIAMWRRVIDNAPTLAPGIEWEKDNTEGDDVWKMTYPLERRRTKKTIGYQVIVPATDKHPAQVEKWPEDVPVGKFIEMHKSGMLSPAEKSDLLDRIDRLLQAVKQARQRANTCEVDKRKIGSALVEYILDKKDIPVQR